jgi:hypothetical protein
MFSTFQARRGLFVYKLHDGTTSALTKCPDLKARRGQSIGTAAISFCNKACKKEDSALT